MCHFTRISVQSALDNRSAPNLSWKWKGQVNTLTACSCWTAVSVAGTACTCFRPWSSCTVSASHTRRRICARLSHLGHWNKGLQAHRDHDPFCSVLFQVCIPYYPDLEFTNITCGHWKFSPFKNNPDGIEARCTKTTKWPLWCWWSLNIILQELASNLSRLIVQRKQACVTFRVCFSSLPKTSSPRSISAHWPDLPIVSNHSKHSIASLNSHSYNAPRKNGFFSASTWDVRYHECKENINER